jgi:beta-glucosidase
MVTALRRNSQAKIPRGTGWQAATVGELSPASLRFPPGFGFGAATSAHQVEGGTTGNNWTRWETHGRPDGGPGILTGERCGSAVDHWHRFPDDLGLMRWLGLDMYRFSFEWSRIEPAPGRIDEEALHRYRDWCARLRAAGIAPVVTLHHFTEPHWITTRGGFENPTTIDTWVRFVERIVEYLGDLVSHWVTVNEPVGYAVQGWWRGVWPPGRTDPALAVRVIEHLLLAHSRAYRVIHRLLGPEPLVGLAHNLVVFRPHRRGNPADRLAARLLDTAYNRAALDALATGRLRVRLPGVRRVVRHDELRGTQDFMGVNFYHPVRVSLRPQSRHRMRVDFAPDAEHNDLGWTLDPAALGEALETAAGYGLPILVTEHGTCDAEEPDLRRRRYLAHSLAVVQAAIARGMDIRAYLHWSLLDNFEWIHGFSARFGLFRVDHTTGTRSPTTAAEFYRKVIAANRIAPP